jgi:transposase
VWTGVAAYAAPSSGELPSAPGLHAAEVARVRRSQRKLARARRGSNRRGKVKLAIARLKARERDRRKDRVEKTSTGLARRFVAIAVEDLQPFLLSA